MFDVEFGGELCQDSKRGYVPYWTQDSTPPVHQFSKLDYSEQDDCQFREGQCWNDIVEKIAVRIVSFGFGIVLVAELCNRPLKIGPCRLSCVMSFTVAAPEAGTYFSWARDTKAL